MLDSWKAIATYFGRTVRTVQRWEREQGLPVHRQLHNSLSSVYAYSSELHAWQLGRVPDARVPDEEVGARVTTATGPTQLRVPRVTYDHYVRGCYYWEKRTLGDLVRAIREFKKALDSEPAWALPYSGLAEAYLALSGNEFWSPMDGYLKARAAAQEALKREPHLPAALTALGFVRAFFDADWYGAEEEFRRALEIDSDYANAHYWSGMAAMNRGRFDEASTKIRHASALAPLSAVIAANIGRPLMCAGRFEEAKSWFARALDLEPDLWVSHVLMGWAHEALKEYAQAVTSLEQAVRLSGGTPTVLALMAGAQAMAGAVDTAREMLAALLADRRSYVAPVRVARVFVALGETDQTFAWLERACVDRSIRNNTYLGFDYAFTALHADPRFVSMVRGHLNLPDYQRSSPARTS